MRAYALLTAAALWVAAPTAAFAQAAPAASAMQTHGPVAFTLPSGWSAASDGKLIVIRPLHAQ